MNQDDGSGLHPGFDITVAHPARVYDYWLGGKDNFEPDRKAAEEVIAVRPTIIRDIREETVEWLDKQGYAVLPSQANMIMIDVRRPGRAFAQAMLKEKVAVGRTWPSMPHHVRVSIGTKAEMAGFRAAFTRVMNA